MNNTKKSVPDKSGLDKGTTERVAAAAARARVEMLTCDIPAEVPIIPLASTVVFPQMVVNLQVVRKKNLNLIRDMEPESIIGLVVQKSSSIDVPPIEELSAVGVAARLVNKINVSGNTIQIILLGLRRFRVASYIQTEPYLKARVACIDEKEEDSMQANMLMGNALHLLENLIQLDPRVPGEILNLIKNNLSGPGNLADQIANHLNFELEEKKEILTTITPIDRLKVAIRLIEKSIGLAKAGQEIKEQTEDEIRKAQREFFLREQMKVIRKELGEESETAGAVRELRDKIEGGWAGQMIGVSFGAPTEFKFNQVQVPREDGLLTIDGDEIRATWLGRIFIRNLAMLFDPYLEQQQLVAKPLFSKTL